MLNKESSNTVKVNVSNAMMKNKNNLAIFHYGENTFHMLDFSGDITLLLGDKDSNDYINLSQTAGKKNHAGTVLITIPIWLDFNILGTKTIVFLHCEGKVTLELPFITDSWNLLITQPVINNQLTANYSIEIKEKVILDNKKVAG